MKLTLKQQQSLWGYIFISPWVLGLALLFAWPLGRSLMLSFQKVTDLFQWQTEWVGLDHYRQIFTEDIVFTPVLLDTLENVAIDVPLILVFSLLLALLLTGVGRGQTFLRAVFFLPVVIGSAGVIQHMLSVGVGDQLLMSTLEPLMQGMGAEVDSVVEGTPIQWIVTRLTAIIWFSGVEILFFIAGLNSIPPSLYEAARVDGASPWESFWKITLPMVSPVILLVTIYAMIDQLTFPENPMIKYIMQVGVRGQQLEYASALGMAYFLVVFLQIALVVRILSKFVFYAGEKP
ncbi:MAG: sugar ABC transporter permease [Caldilineaceae bacterium]|nr:sugar ABC transporter permease [Caldilineaceae bacterium]MDE0068424.1 sugar ABC transporter permease [Caldilineaceae bacterium]MDE0180282.1 sugar ABC transporter permease [Caldilineaceae bacterium]